MATRHLILSEDDLGEFARMVAEGTDPGDSWVEERVIGRGVDLDPEAEKALTPEVRKIAVDTLYAAREANKVMDQDAILVAAAVLTEVGRKWNRPTFILLCEAEDDSTPLSEVGIGDAVQGSLSLAADADEVYVFRGREAVTLKHRDFEPQNVHVAVQRRGGGA